MAAVIVGSDFGAQENKIHHCFHCFPFICHELMEPDAMILVFWMLSLKPAFSLSSFTFIRRHFSTSLLSAIRVVLSAYLRLWIFLPPILIPTFASPSLAFRTRFSTVQFSHSVVSDSLRPHESQHTRPPCPSPTPGVYPNPSPSSQWCHPAISSSVVPFSSCPQSFPASGSFPMSQLFTWGGQTIEVSASASVLPMNTQDLSPSG